MPEIMDATQWLEFLQPRLSQAEPSIRRYEDQYAGRHRLAFDSEPFREAFGEQLAQFSTNWCELVVDAVVERLTVLGFRFSATDSPDVEQVDAGSADPEVLAAAGRAVQTADKDAWGIWQANRMDKKSVKVHTEQSKLGTAFVCVSPPGDDGVPRITPEHPSQVIVVTDPSDNEHRLAALKRYRAPNGDDIAVVYTPDSITTFRSKGTVQRLQRAGLILPPTLLSWDDETTVPNPLGVVPIVPFENKAGVLGGGVSDLRPAVALNDAANKFFSDMIVASEYAAFPQRVLTGVEIPRGADGQPTADVQLQSSMKRLWAFEPSEAKVTSLQAAELSNYVAAIDTAIQHLAAQTRTPPHYLLAKLANLSADALQAAEAGLVYKADRKKLDASDDWEEVMRLAFRWRAIWRRNKGDADGALLDEARGADLAAETIWASSESRSPAVVADALVKRRAIGIPEEVLWEDAGYTPRQIDRMRVLRKQELDEQIARQALEVSTGAAVTLTERPADTGN